jgi:glycerophosphoryl diester phosphodiesterase
MYTAFKHSARLGVDLLELDVQLTLDGHVVIFHDSSLQRLCGVPGRIQDLLYSDLPPLLVPTSLSSLVAVTSDPASTRIPLLLDLLAVLPLYPMQIDVKDASEHLVKLVGSYILQHKRAEYTVW